MVVQINNLKGHMTKEDNKEALDRALEEFFAKGGVVQQLKQNQSGRVDGASYSSWSKKKPSTSPLANPPDED